MDRTALIEQARQFAERGFADRCTITRRTSTEGTDSDGNVVESVEALYAGPCRIQQGQPNAERNGAGEAYLLLLAIVVQLPMSVTGLEPDDVVTVDSSATDPDLPGRKFVVRGLAHKTDASSRRIQAQEITS